MYQGTLSVKFRLWDVSFISYPLSTQRIYVTELN